MQFVVNRARGWLCVDIVELSSIRSIDLTSLALSIAQKKDIPGRFSRLLQLPVSHDDGLSVYCCRKCVGRLNSVEKTIEEMKSLANSSYSKAGYAPPVNSSPLSRERSRKRVKDTSSNTASPHT